MASQYITSPGVQINEVDLSLRSSFNPGTTVVLPGFAAQGPVTEPIFVSTVSELESIYGTPTNAAERYFYYSCREVLNSPASLVAVRLPYGENAGEGFSNSYSGLFYPMSLSSASGTAVSAWQIEEPIHVDLNEERYINLLQGNYDWVDPEENLTVNKFLGNIISLTLSANKGTSINGVTGTSGVFTLTAVPSFLQTVNVNLIYDAANDIFTPEDSVTQAYGAETFTVGTTSFNIVSVSASNESILLNCGFFVLNSLQTSINEAAEGYYVGFADNSAFSSNSEDYVSIKALKTVNATGYIGEGFTKDYIDINDTKLEFGLSATAAEANYGATSISERLEKVGFIGFESESYQDHLSFGIFKIRKSTADATKLSLGPVQRYIGSFDFNRKQISPTGGILQNAYLEEVVNADSNTIKAFINPAISRAHDWSSEGSATPTTRLTVLEGAKALFPLGTYSPNTLAQEQVKLIGEVPLKLDRAMLLIENPETILVDVVVDAGLSTVYSYSVAGGEGYFDDEMYMGELDESQYENWKSVTDMFVKFAADNRKDCMAIIDPPRNIFVTGKNLKVIDTPAKNFKQHIYDPLRTCFDKYESNYAASYANWVKQNDLFTGKKIWLPFSGYAAAIFARSDASTFPWVAPAGLNRGNFNTIDLAFNPNQKQRDRLYEIPVNPVAFFSGDGFTVMGQKTLQNKPSAFDRINVRRLFLTLERAVQKSVRFYVFEPNTEFTRSSLVNTITPLFEYAKNNEGLYDYLIVCDARNNTPDIIDNNQLIVDIYLKPVRAAEFILVNFIATRTGQDFTELI